MPHYVDITFDCLPLRSVGRWDIPIDASPTYRARCERIKQQLATYGMHNTYYLYNAKCKFHLTNEADVGMLEFRFDGTVMTDATDQKTQDCMLEVELIRETCDWLQEPIVAWFGQSVSRAVAVEFDRYIAAGDLAQTKKRIELLQAQTDAQGGFVGMGL
ncbi:MAG TPA: hypothetical protein VFE24_07240 [Pirellulales bacterium]|jgi:hypothetical protein|nr:hypothetical protein [Pirellulales bacterium]